MKIEIELNPTALSILERICKLENNRKNVYGKYDIRFFTLWALTDKVRNYCKLLDTSNFLHAIADKITVSET